MADREGKCEGDGMEMEWRYNGDEMGVSGHNRLNGHEGTRIWKGSRRKEKMGKGGGAEG